MVQVIFTVFCSAGCADAAASSTSVATSFGVGDLGGEVGHGVQRQDSLQQLIVDPDPKEPG